MNIGIFLPNWLGDLVMATPALRALRRQFPRPHRLVGILRPNLAELLAGTDWLDEQWCFDPHSPHSEWRRWALVRQMRRQRFDKVLLLTNSLHTAILAWLGGAPERIGYARDGRGLLLTQKLYPPRNGRDFAPIPAVDSYLALAAAMGCPAESPRLELAVTDAERRLADCIWSSLRLNHASGVVALNAGGAFGEAKRWPAEHCVRLARLIVERLHYHVLVLCGPKEADTARAIARAADSPRVVSLADQPYGLPATKGCLARCRMLVSTDSGPRHVAAALGKPVVTLFGPTLPAWVANPTVQDTTLQADLDCLGCGRRTCPRGHHRCMKDLTPERVLDAVSAWLEPSAARAA